MTENERVKMFKSHNLVINCRTEDEAEKFVKWCYQNGFKWFDTEEHGSTITNWYLNKNETAYRYDEQGYLAYGSAKNYRGVKIVTYKEFFNEEKINLEWMIENIDTFKTANSDNVCSVVYELKNKKQCEEIHCEGCEFNKTINVLKYLAEKHSEKIKVTQFEYDLIDSINKDNTIYNITTMLKFPIFIRMKEKGYFKNIESLNRLGEVYERMEVEK